MNTTNYNPSAAIICSIVASFSMALTGLFSKFDLNILFLLVVRFFLPMLTVAFLVFIILRNPVSLRNIRMHFYRACFVFINQAAYFYTCKHSSLLVAILLFNTAPLFIPLLSYFFFRETSNRTTIFSIIFGAIGVVFILNPNPHDLLDYTALVGLLSGFSLACSQLILQRNVKNEGNLSCMFWFYFLSTIISIVVLAIVEFLYGGNYAFNINYNFTTAEIIAGITISTLLFQFFVGLSYKYWTLAKLAPFMYFSIVFSGILDIIIWHQWPTISNYIGMLIITAACINIIRHRTTKTSKQVELTMKVTSNA